MHTNLLRRGAAVIAALGCFLLGGSPAPAQDDREADHAALRDLREQFTAAVNSRDFGKIKPLLTDSFTFTTIDNLKLTGVAEMEAHWNKMLDGDKAILDSITVAPESDALTRFFEGDVGVVEGRSHDVFDFKTVGRREMESRWSAVVRKVDGAWKIESVHMSGNVLDNPVLGAVEKVGNIKAAVALLAGLVAGFLLRAVIARPKKVPVP